MKKSCSVCGRIHDYNDHCHRLYTKQITDESKLRSTNRWRKKSLSIREKADYLCEVCRDKGIYTYDNIQVHHIEKIANRKDLLLDDLNLICLCEVHHKMAEAGEFDKDYLRQLAEDREYR